MSKLLEVVNLVVHFDTDGGLVEVLDDVNITMHAGEILGLVGEFRLGEVGERDRDTRHDPASRSNFGRINSVRRYRSGPSIAG